MVHCCVLCYHRSVNICRDSRWGRCQETSGVSIKFCLLCVPTLLLITLLQWSLHLL